MTKQDENYVAFHKFIMTTTYAPLTDNTKSKKLMGTIELINAVGALSDLAMPLTEAQLNRRDAMSAEADQSQSPEDVSLEGDWFGHSLPLLFLRRSSRLCVCFLRGRDSDLHRLAPHPGDLGACRNGTCHRPGSRP
jgi:hypothetical protein